MKRITLLISVYGENLLNIPNILLSPKPNVDYVIVSQKSTSEVKSAYLKLISKRNDVQSFFSEESGVARSRNLALKKIPPESDFIYFVDDDVILEPECTDLIISAFMDSDCDILTFSAADLSGNTPLKNYSKNAFVHNKISIFKVGTIEIAAKSSIFINSDTIFPEYLGAGSKYPVCDEPVFLSRLMRAGYKAGFSPEVVVRHPLESSGKLIDNEYAMISRGIAFREVFGVSCVLFGLLFFLKNFHSFKYDKFKALKDLYKGMFKVYRQVRNN